MIETLPPDFSLDDPPAPGVAVTRATTDKRTLYLARLSALQGRFDLACAQHDQSADPMQRRLLLTTIAVMLRKMSWYKARIPGAQAPGSATGNTRGHSSRLSDQIASLDAILSRLP